MSSNPTFATRAKPAVTLGVLPLPFCLALLTAVLLLPETARSADAPQPLGHVVEVHGAVSATAPGEKRLAKAAKRAGVSVSGSDVIV